MAKRVLVTVTPDADPDEVTASLRAAGATRVTPPRPELPGVAVAEVPDDDSVTLEQLEALPGVERAEPDELRWSQ